MDESNPYLATENVSEPGPRRPPTWAGTAVIVLAVIVYGPMTVTPFVRAVLGQEIGFMLAVTAWNGTIFLGMLWLGRWLRRRAVAASVSSQIQRRRL